MNFKPAFRTTSLPVYMRSKRPQESQDCEDAATDENEICHNNLAGKSRSLNIFDRYNCNDNYSEYSNMEEGNIRHIGTVSVRSESDDGSSLDGRRSDDLDISDDYLNSVAMSDQGSSNKNRYARSAADSDDILSVNSKLSMYNRYVNSDRHTESTRGSLRHGATTTISERSSMDYSDGDFLSNPDTNATSDVQSDLHSMVSSESTTVPFFGWLFGSKMDTSITRVQSNMHSESSLGSDDVASVPPYTEIRNLNPTATMTLHNANQPINSCCSDDDDEFGPRPRLATNERPSRGIRLGLSRDPDGIKSYEATSSSRKGSLSSVFLRGSKRSTSSKAARNATYEHNESDSDTIVTNKTASKEKEEANVNSNKTIDDAMEGAKDLTHTSSTSTTPEALDIYDDNEGNVEWTMNGPTDRRNIGTKSISSRISSMISPSSIGNPSIALSDLNDKILNEEKSSTTPWYCRTQWIMVMLLAGLFLATVLIVTGLVVSNSSNDRVRSFSAATDGQSLPSDMQVVAEPVNVDSLILDDDIGRVSEVNATTRSSTDSQDMTEDVTENDEIAIENNEPKYPPTENNIIEDVIGGEEEAIENDELDYPPTGSETLESQQLDITDEDDGSIDDKTEVEKGQDIEEVNEEKDDVDGTVGISGAEVDGVTDRGIEINDAVVASTSEIEINNSQEEEGLESGDTTTYIEIDDEEDATPEDIISTFKNETNDDGEAPQTVASTAEIEINEDEKSESVESAGEIEINENEDETLESVESAAEIEIDTGEDETLESAESAAEIEINEGEDETSEAESSDSTKLQPTSQPSALLSLDTPPASSTASPPSPSSLDTSTEDLYTPRMASFAAIGDAPYDRIQATILEEQMQDMDPSAEFLIHVGDIRKNDDGDCTRDEFEAVAEILEQSPIPVFIILGDNDYNDCANMEDALRYWEDSFGGFYARHWDVPFEVSTQPGRPDNFAFVHEDVLFIGLNIVGGKPGGSDEREEWGTRLLDQAEWTESLITNYDLGMGQYTGRVVIFGHADPSKYHATFFDSLTNFMRVRLQNRIPVLYVNGDDHYFNVVENFYDSPSFMRLMVAGETVEPPTIIRVISTGSAMDLDAAFLFERGDEYDDDRLNDNR